MKNKRNVLIAFILICCLCLSIGYAALTDTLYVNGTVAVNVDSDNDGTDETTPFEKEFEQDVHWQSATAEKDTSANVEVTAAVDSSDNDKLTIGVPAGILTSEDDKTVITAIIINESQDYGAKISLAENGFVDTTDEHTTVTWEWTTTQPQGTVLNADNTVTIPEGGTASVVFTVTLTKAPIEDINNSQFSVTYTAKAVE